MSSSLNRNIQLVKTQDCRSLQTVGFSRTPLVMSHHPQTDLRLRVSIGTPKETSPLVTISNDPLGLGGRLGSEVLLGEDYDETP